VFTVYTIKEFIRVSKNPKSEIEMGPRADMIRFVGRLFDSPVKSDEEANQKIAMYKAVQRTISDMESDGVYFTPEIKEELRKKREELTCEYSGLPSVEFYK
jgi:hypothetical protein